ncbi:MAG: AAA family ATPase, partial [Proteobacteria bacterium]
MSVKLWTEAYRPNTFDEYVWRDSSMRQKCQEWVQARAMPHLLLEGVAGTGKTSLAYLMLNQIGIGSGDILHINASRERKIEDIQSKIIGFVGSWALNDTGIKYVVLDEADKMSPLAQGLLRGEMETYHRECRFILTCNYASKIIEPVHSRCQTFSFRTLDRDDFTARVGEILVSEQVDFEVEDLLTLVEQTYPDLRKAINLAQQSSYISYDCLGDTSYEEMGNTTWDELSKGPITTGSGKQIRARLHKPKADESGIKDYMLEMTNLFRAGRTNEARKLIIAQAQAEEYIDIYRYLYRNLDIWGDSEDIQDNVLLAIRKGLVNHSVAADQELNLAATFVECKLIA